MYGLNIRTENYCFQQSLELIKKNVRNRLTNIVQIV